MILMEQREPIRQFMLAHPCVTQQQMADLFCVAQARISEVVRRDEKRGGA